MPADPTPLQIAIARAAVDVTNTCHFHTGTAQNAWDTLKAARGQIVHFDRLTPAHIISTPAAPAEPISFADMMQARMDRVAAHVRKLRDQSSLGGAA